MSSYGWLVFCVFQNIKIPLILLERQNGCVFNINVFLTCRMKGVKTYDAKARKRDLDEWKLEKKRNVDQYFDKWSKITSRYFREK